MKDKNLAFSVSSFSRQSKFETDEIVTLKNEENIPKEQVLESFTLAPLLNLLPEQRGNL